MIEKLVGFVLRMPAVVIALTAALVCAGLYSYSVLDVEAYPNPVPPHGRSHHPAPGMVR